MTYKATLSMRRQLAIFAGVMLAYHLVVTFGMAVMTESRSPHALTELTLGGPAYFVCMFALVCGANLGLDRKRYGPSAMLFPITRTRHALVTIGVDIGGLVLAYAIACGLSIGSFVLVSGFRALHGGSWLACVIIPIASFVGLYGLSAFSSVAIGHGRLVGPALAVVCFIALMMTAPDVPGHLTFQWLNVINPVVYLYLASEQLLGPPPILDFYHRITPDEIAQILCILAVAYLALAVASFSYRRRWSGAFAAGAVALLAFTAVGARADADFRVERVIEASGIAMHASAMRHVRILHLTIRASRPGTSGPVESWTEIGRLRNAERFAVAPNFGGDGWDGKNNWSLDARGRVTLDTDPTDRDQTIVSAFVHGYDLWAPDRGGASVRYGGRRRDGGHAYDVLRITPRGSRVSADLWIDAATHLPARLIEIVGRVTYVEMFSDYRPVHGLMVAFGEREFAIGGGVTSERVTRADVDPRDGEARLREPHASR